MTQEALAAAAGMGQPDLVEIEAGQRTATQEILGRIAAVLKVEVDDLKPAEID